MIERLFPLIRVRSGDYLLLSNDRQTLWRISRYEEDGSLEDGEGKPVKGTFWEASRWLRSLDDAELLLVTDEEKFLSWDIWSVYAALQPTRAAAVEAALERGA